MFVAISYGKGVIFCEQYEKCGRDYFANFIRRNFRKLFRVSGKTHLRRFVQNNCPIQNCAKARQVMKAVGAKLFAFPPRSCDLLAIENVFNLVKRKLRLQALCRNLVYESVTNSFLSVRSTLYRMSTSVIDNIIKSLHKRLCLIIKYKGKGIKY